MDLYADKMTGGSFVAVRAPGKDGIATFVVSKGDFSRSAQRSWMVVSNFRNAKVTSTILGLTDES